MSSIYVAAAFAQQAYVASKPANAAWQSAAIYKITVTSEFSGGLQ